MVRLVRSLVCVKLILGPGIDFTPNTQDRSRVRQRCTLGSARGLPKPKGEGRPYRDLYTVSTQTLCFFAFTDVGVLRHYSKLLWYGGGLMGSGKEIGPDR